MLRRAISENFSIEDVFRIILETMYRGLHRLGARRTVFFMRGVREPKFMVRLALGQIIKVGLTMAIDGKDEDIIGILLKEQKDLFTSNTMSERAAPLGSGECFWRPFMRTPFTYEAWI